MTWGGHLARMRGQKLLTTFRLEYTQKDTVLNVYPRKGERMFKEAGYEGVLKVKFTLGQAIQSHRERTVIAVHFL